MFGDFTSPDHVTHSKLQNIYPGVSTHRVRLEKPFDPFEVQLSLSASRPGLYLQKWVLMPAPDQRIPDTETEVEKDFLSFQLRFEKDLRLTGFLFQFPESPGEELKWGVRAQIPENLPLKFFREAVVFIHLIKPDGTLAQALDIPLSQASFATGKARIHRTYPASGLESLNSIQVRMGMYNPRTKLRLEGDVEGELPEHLSFEDSILSFQPLTSPVWGKSLPKP